MSVRLLTSPEDLSAYDQWVKAHPQGMLWQSLEWKKYQDALGRETRLYIGLEDSQIVASALVVIDRTAFGLSTWDTPRGPLIGENGKWKVESLMEQIINEAKKDKCISLFLSPLQPLSTLHFPLSTFHFPLSTSSRHEQPEATRIIDLTKSEEEILAQMKPKGRYNITVAEKHGVRIAHSEDASAFFSLVKGTTDRDKFTGLPLSHYKAFLKELPHSFLLLAYLPSSPGGGAGGGGPIAGLIGIIWNGTAIYYYGASSYAHRALMGPYLLQWEAMRFCKGQGCHSYDLLGVAPPSADPEHPWTGISAFKDKFGGSLVEYPKEQRIVLRRAAGGLLRAKRKLFG
ncbi:peptidoglycan bridge formation glycyltransferase FemA/FemB family protein [Candidatus Peregrinibacteria bacterium]|nr:peptidoglycan bridge formation glycyltransferase FemA/FemB family protein [Candidatus Peregrinibacteria bacterium]